MFDHATALLAAAPVSPLLLSDHLITLAEQAYQAGYQTTARRLVALAYKVLEEPALGLPALAAGH